MINKLHCISSSLCKAYGKNALKNAILPHATFNFLTEKVLGTRSHLCPVLRSSHLPLLDSGVRAQNAELLTKYAPIAKSRCPFLKDDEIAGVAHGLVDGALTFAGGLSIPSVITSMLGVLYSGSHGDFSKTYNTPGFLWETVRLYPAVVGVPFANTGTTQRQVSQPKSDNPSHY